MKKSLNFKLTNKDAIIIADVQNDFLPGGALAVFEGNQIIPILNNYARIFSKNNAKVIASRDWHPKNHISFKAQGGPWSPHCVQETEGAKFHPDLKLPKGTKVVSKATNPKEEAYSVFDGTGLANYFKVQGVTRIFVGGLATDYCIVSTVLDARKLGFKVGVLLDGCRGINVNPGDIDRAMEAMMKSGAEPITIIDFLELENISNEENTAEDIADKSILITETKKKARMRPKGSYKQVRRERG